LPDKGDRDFVDKLMKELSEYTIGDEELSKIFEPLLERCAKLSKTADEFKRCVTEAVTTLKSALGKVK
jgi:hypothetical protein